MGVDHPGGPGKGPETIDKPTTQGNGDKPPAQNNGSSSETPRADSLRAAGWNLEGYGETGTDQRDDHDQRTGESSTTGSTGDKQRGPGAPPTETDPKADKEPQTGKTGSATDDPKTTTAKTSGTDGRDHPQGRPPGRETDSRAEPPDRAASSAGQYKMPADNPGSPGQPSRLESLARTREAQQQRAAQNAEGTNGSSGPPSETRDGGPTAPQEGNRADTAQPPGQTDTGGTGRDAQGEEQGERKATGGEDVRQDEHPPETPPADTRAATGGTAGGEHDRPASQLSGEQGGGPAPETGRPQDQEHPPLPHQNNAAAPTDSRTPPETKQNPPGTDRQGTGVQSAREQGDGQPRPEASAETGDQTTGPTPTPPDSTHGTPEPSGRDAQPVQEAGTNSQAPDGSADNGRTPPHETPLSPEAPRPAEAGEPGTEQPAQAPQDRPGTEQPGDAATGTPDNGTTGDAPAVPQEGEPAQPPINTGEAAPGGTAPDSGTDERSNTDDPPPPSEEADQSAGAPGPPGEQDGDHGKKGPEDDSKQNPSQTNRTNPEVPNLPDGSTPPDRNAPQSTENKNPGREVAPQQEAPVETEPSRFSGKVTIAVDSDGRPVPPDQEPVESEVGTRGRGEFGSPEDDPVDRDPREEDSERPSRRREVYRGIVDKPSDAKKSMDTFAEPAQRGVERVPPTGQHTGSRGNIDQFRAPDHAVKAGDAALGVAGVVIVAYETTRRSVNWIRQKLGRDRGDNR
ncbi:hypothetical protein [Actinomadura chokoriensis]|uniref:hypothetical protein n=1 Tax=Actinomadura chokoriensis TaxID=454156 RepID=UPI0031F73632